MAGFRTFATGEVLTAANVNDFLMGQSVMRFADADARTAALGADVVEGMLTYNLDTDQLEVFDGTNFVVAAPEPPAPPAGIGSNVVSTLENGVVTESVALNGISGDVITATITPTSANSKILVVAILHTSDPGNMSNFVLFRDGTQFAVGAASQSRPLLSSSTFALSENHSVGNVSAFVLDSPSTTDPVLYSARIRMLGGGGVVHLNRNATDANNRLGGRTVSSLTLIEVAA